MKKVLIFAFCFLLIACCQLKTIKPKGEITTEPRSVELFDKITVGSGINLVVYNGEQEVLVQAKQNVHEYIETEVKNNCLIIKLQPRISFSGNHNTTVYVTAENINGIEASGGAKVSIPSVITSSGLKLSASGGSRINGGFECETMELKLSGGSKSQLNIHARELHLKMSGGCSADFSGNADIVESTLSGGCKLNASDLASERLTIDMSGGTNASVNVQEYLKADLSGGSKLKYEGSPRVEGNTSGGAKISHVS